jgi:ribosomal protein S18 acetylase RimI-like enzyme
MKLEYLYQDETYKSKLPLLSDGMYLERIYDTESRYFEQAFRLYEASFVYEERRDLAGQTDAMKTADYHFCVILDGEEFCGIVLYWEIGDLIYLEHLATRADLRCRGIGSQALDLLKQGGKTIILEIEPPVDELTSRRLGFYERNGFFLAPYHHIQAKYHIGDPDVELKILSYPALIAREKYDEFYEYMLKNISL